MCEVGSLRFTPVKTISMGYWTNSPVLNNFLKTFISLIKHNTEYAKFVYLFWVIECLTDVALIVSRS